MPYTMQDFRRDYVKEHLKDLTFEEVLQGLTLEQRLDGVPLKEIEVSPAPQKTPISPQRKNQKEK